VCLFVYLEMKWETRPLFPVSTVSVDRVVSISQIDKTKTNLERILQQQSSDVCLSPSRQPQQISVTGEDRSQKIFKWRMWNCFVESISLFFLILYYPFFREREKKTTIRVVYNMSKTTVSRFFWGFFFLNSFYFGVHLLNLRCYRLARCPFYYS
jgi:hypothetical protein